MKFIAMGLTACLVGFLLLVTGLTGISNRPEKISEGTTSVITPANQKDAAVDAKTFPVAKIEASGGQVILLNTEVDEMSIDIIIQQIEMAKQHYKKLYLVISSPGGSVVAGAKLLSYVESSDVEIDTVCVELCASMALHIFEGGKVRYITDRSILMGHSASGMAQGTLPNMLSMLTAVQKLVARMEAKAARRAGIPYKDYELMQLKNMWIEAPDAVQMGLADKIVHFTYNARGRALNTAEEMRRQGFPVKDGSILEQVYNFH